MNKAIWRDAAIRRGLDNAVWFLEVNDRAASALLEEILSGWFVAAVGVGIDGQGYVRRTWLTEFFPTVEQTLDPERGDGIEAAGLLLYDETIELEGGMLTWQVDEPSLAVTVPLEALEQILSGSVPPSTLSVMDEGPVAGGQIYTIDLGGTRISFELPQGVVLAT